MAQNETWLKHDLLEAVKVQYLDGNLFSMDNAGNLIGVMLTRDGEDYSGGGSVSANVIRSDGGTVAVIGALSGKTATVVLPQAAYAVPGVVSIIVKLTASGQVTTIAALVANVYRSSTDTAIDPGTIIPSIQTLISQINTAVASIPADYSALWTKLAPAFSTDASYVAGQYVTYNSGLWRFNTTHSGSWSSSDVTAVNLGGEITDLKSAINDTDSTFSDFLQSELGKTTYAFTAENNKAWYTSESPVELKTPNNTAWKFCKIPCVFGDVFHVNINAGTSNYRPWAFVDASMGLLSKASVNVVDTDITAPENAAYLLCNGRYDPGVTTGVHKVTKGNNIIEEIESNIDDIEGRIDDIEGNIDDVEGNISNNIEPYAFSYLKGKFERNAWRTDNPYTKLNNRAWKVRSADYIVYDTNVELIAKDGYAFYFATLDSNNAFIYVGWGMHYGFIPANTKFIITIVADPEDRSVTADPDVYKKMVRVRACEPFRLRWPAYMKDRLHFGAHRGWRGDEDHYPENSIPAFEKAGQKKAWAIESDIWETTDNYFVIMHDETVNRTTDGSGKIADMTLSQVQALHLKNGSGEVTDLTVPTFEQFLEVCKIYGCVAMIEVKGLQNGLTSFINVKNIIQKYGMMDYVAFIVHDRYVYDYARRNFHESPIQFLTEPDQLYSDYSDYLNAMQCLGNTLCALNTSDNALRLQRINLVHQKQMVTGVTSSSWDAQKVWFANGCDLIMSNDNLSVPDT